MAKLLETLKDIEEKMGSDYIVYLGSQKGSGWVIIDKVSTIISNIDDLEARIKNKSIEAVKKSEKEMIELPSIIDARRKAVDEFPDSEKMNKDGETDAWKKVQAMLIASRQKFVTAFNRNIKHTKILSQWVPFNKRTVTDVYFHDYDVQGTAVIVKGEFIGDYWTKEEQDNGIVYDDEELLMEV